MLAGIAGTVPRRAEWEMDQRHANALQRRGLSVEMAARLGWRPCAGPGDDLWIAMPVVDQGKRVGTKYRTITQPGQPKQIDQQKGTPQIFHNIDCLRRPELSGYPLVITEGEFDMLAAIQSGYPRTVSVPSGAPSSDSGAEWSYLTHAKSLLAEQRLIVLATDADPPGQILQAGLAARLGRSRCKVLAYPTGKDLGDVLMAAGEQAVRHTIAQAYYIPLPGLMRLCELPELKPRSALDTMIPGLTEHLRIRKGDFLAITGPPGHGKSTFVCNLVSNMAWHWKTRAVLASMEQSIKPDLRRVLRSYRAERRRGDDAVVRSRALCRGALPGRGNDRGNRSVERDQRRQACGLDA